MEQAQPFAAHPATRRHLATPDRTYLPRLPREHYTGNAVVLWTLTILHRATGWLNEPLHHHFRELIFHTRAREALVCPIYCLMPDHIHLVWMGLSRESDQFTAMTSSALTWSQFLRLRDCSPNPTITFFATKNENETPSRKYAPISLRTPFAQSSPPRPKNGRSQIA